MVVRADALTPIMDLEPCGEPVEIYDSQGKYIGMFLPASLSTNQSAREGNKHLFDPVEIERRRIARLPGYTTRQVFEHLKSLTTDEPTRAQLQQYIDRLGREEGCATP